LYEDLNEKPPRISISAHTADDTEVLALNIREKLGVTREIQSGFGNEHKALNWWRSALETQGVLVFQASGLDVSEMRGFSIADRPLPIIVVNIKDSPRARIFSMLHELVHVVIRQGGICDLDEDEYRHASEQEIEIFCNRVAGATLVPESELFREDPVIGRDDRVSSWSDQEIRAPSNRYWVSREVLLRRLLICGLITKEFYKEKRSELAAGQKPRSRGFVPPAQMAISAAGHSFIRLVLDNYYQENITSSDVAAFLAVNLKHVAEIEEKVMGHRVLFGAVA
jgi:Zn-dependent peptidase ImmA (M78 family)